MVRNPSDPSASSSAEARAGVRSICLYTPSFNASGMGRHMLDLAAEFTKAHEVSFMAWATPTGATLLEEAAALGAKPVPLPAPRDPSFAEVIVEFLEAHHVDVFHVHVGFGRENFDGARAARWAGVRAIVQTQHLPWRLSSPRKRVPFFRAIAAVDRLIAVSDGVRRTYEEIGVERDAIRTIPNGIRARGPGPGRDAARRMLGLRPDQLVVMNVGRLIEMKGQRHLVDATRQLADAYPQLAMVIVGDGNLHDDLKRQARVMGVEDLVHLPGHRPDARMLLDAADVFVLPSKHEGMPLAILEAMDAGLPVVATRVIGVDEVVAHRETGILVDKQDAASLSEALGRLLGDETLRAQYAAQGRRRFQEHFTSERMAAQTLHVYDEVLGDDSGVPSRTPVQRTGRRSLGRSTLQRVPTGRHAARWPHGKSRESGR